MTATSDRATETGRLDSAPPVIPESTRAKARHAAPNPVTDRGRWDDPAELRARIALIRAHLAAADTELRDAPSAYADQADLVLDDEQADDRAGVDGPGRSR